MGSSTTRHQLVAGAVAAVALLAAAGCGSSSSSGESGKPAKTVLADTKSALFNARSVHVVGTITDSGTNEKIDFHFQGQQSEGSVDDDGTTAQIINTGGQLYVKGPAAYWTKIVGAQGAALAGKWIKAPAGQDGDLTLQNIAAGLNSEDSPLQTKTDRATIDGQKAIVLSQQDGSKLYVADATPPLPLKIIQNGDSKGTIVFTEYGKTQTITAPAGAVTAQQAVKTGSQSTT